MTDSEQPRVNRFFTINDFAKKNKEQGCWPNTALTINHLRFKSPANGFGDAFFTIGSRVLINEEKFIQALERIQAKQALE